MAIFASAALRAEHQALSRERDSELRCEGLLALASRQERHHRPELALQIYSELLQDPEISESLSRRARVRFDALRGEGELGARAEVLFSRFSEQATEPTSLLAMTAAGLAFRATRFLTLGRLASAPAGVLTRGTGARALAGLAGFGVEATVFPMAGRLGNLALGRELDWSGRALGHELISSALTLGALRAGGFATGALVNPNGYFRPLAQQAGMFGGIVLGHELEVRAGLRERSSGSIAMLDSLVTLLHFNVAGRLSRHLMGEGLRSWEHRLEQQTRMLGNTSWRLPNPPTLELRPDLVAAGTALRLEGNREPFGPDRVYMSQEGEGGNGNGNGGRREGRDANNTLPFITVVGQKRSPYYIDNPMAIGRRIREPSLEFEKRIKVSDIEFQVESVFDTKPYVPTLLEALNRMLNGGMEVAEGRKVILIIHPAGEIPADRIVLRRGANGFEQVEGNSEPPASPSRNIDPMARTEYAMPAVTLPRSEPTVARAKVKPRPSHLMLVTDQVDLVPALLLQLAERRENGQGTPVLVLEGQAIHEIEQLKELTAGLGPRLPETAAFDLMTPESEATWSGMRLGDNIHWSRLQTSQLIWQTAKFHAVQPKITLASVSELYQQIYAISRLPARAADAETLLQLTAPVLGGENPAGIALEALNRYRVAGRRVRLELENEASHEFLGDQGRWLSADAPRPESKPASRPPLVGGPVEYHSARWRTGLNQLLQAAPHISVPHHEFYLMSQVPLAANDIQSISTRLNLGSGALEVLRIHDQAAQKLWVFQRQNGEWRGEEGVWESQIRWRPYEGQPQGAIEAINLMDLLRQIPGTIHGSQPLHVLMQGSWSAQNAASFTDGLNQAHHPHSSLRPSVVLHYEMPEAGPRRQIYQRSSIGEWYFLEAVEGT